MHKPLQSIIKTEKISLGHDVKDHVHLVNIYLRIFFGYHKVEWISIWSQRGHCRHNLVKYFCLYDFSVTEWNFQR